MPQYTIHYSRDAQADLVYLGRQVEVRVRRAVERFLADQPVPLADQEGQRKSLDENPLQVTYRLRVDMYRVYYNVEAATDDEAGIVRVVRVGTKPRGTVYLRGQPFDMRD